MAKNLNDSRGHDRSKYISAHMKNVAPRKNASTSSSNMAAILFLFSSESQSGDKDATLR